MIIKLQEVEDNPKIHTKLPQDKQSQLIQKKAKKEKNQNKQKQKQKAAAHYY